MAYLVRNATYPSAAVQQKRKEFYQLLGSKQFWVPSVIGLHLLIILAVIQWTAYDAIRGNKIEVLNYLWWYSQVWYTRAMLAPIAMWVAFRKPFEPSRMVRSITVYIAASIGIGIAGSVSQSFLLVGEYGSSFPTQNTQRPAVSKIPAHTLTPPEKILLEGYHFFLYNVFTCWTVMGVMQAVDFNRQAQRKQLIASELESQLARVRLEVLRMQLNPHFLFNTLHAISTLIHTDVEAADAMLLSVSDLLRLLLQEETGAEVELRKELQTLRCQLDIEQMRFRDRLTTHIHASPDLLDCAVPQLLLQPLVENAIRHGIGRRSGSDHVEVFIHSHNEQLLLEVRNSSSSLDRSPDEAMSRGIGLRNTRQRLQTLYQGQHSFELQNLSPVGVSVKIAIPLRHIAPEERGLPQEAIA